jgi:hypothetical protein
MLYAAWNNSVEENKNLTDLIRTPNERIKIMRYETDNLKTKKY